MPGFLLSSGTCRVRLDVPESLGVTDGQFEAAFRVRNFSDRRGRFAYGAGRVRAASLTAGRARPDDAGASRNAGGVRPGDTNVTNLVAEGDVAVGGDLTVTGECVGCGSTVNSLDDIPDLTASKPMTTTLADAGQLVLNGGAFDEDVSVLRVKTSENVETLSVTEDGEVWLGASGRFGIGPPGDYKVYMDAYGVSVVGSCGRDWSAIR